MNRSRRAAATVFVAALLGASSAWSAAESQPISTAAAIKALSVTEAQKHPRAVFEATVTYRHADETTLFVQDGDAGLYVYADTKFKMQAGDRVRIRGHAQDSFRPIVVAEDVQVLHHGKLPKAIPATLQELKLSQHDCRRVSLRGTVQSADLGRSYRPDSTHMVLWVDGGLVYAYVDNHSTRPLSDFLDAEVEVTGVAQAKFDGKMQPMGLAISVASIDDIKILKRAATSPWSLPLTPMDQMLPRLHVSNSNQRVRVEGSITYYQPGSALVLQNGAKSVWIQTLYELPLRIGNRAEVTGFPAVHNTFLALTNGEVLQNDAHQPVAPQPVTRKDLTSSRHLFDLVAMEAKVEMEIRESSQDEYVLTADGQVFSAIYRHPENGEKPLPRNVVPLGARVRVTGICTLESSEPWDKDVPFSILMRTPDDITVVASPSLLTIRNLAILVGVLLVCMFAVGVRGWIIERRVRRETLAMAYLEQRRSRILEDINGSRALPAILDQITEMASLKLQGAPCWYRLPDGPEPANAPHTLAAMRILEEPIPARAGGSLGTIFAAFDPLAKPAPHEQETLAMAAALSALAIETRRLYSDLLHRSEFDLLTNTHNRFSLDKYLDALIGGTRKPAGIFALIYIDLDKFKEVNDRYGHHVGDEYLQEVALRMKSQLRSHDRLARLGGDEFAVLLPEVRSRAEVEDVARRLDRCLDGAFVFAECTIHGSASVGFAIYPEDGVSKDTLLRTADAAMYAVKNARRVADPVPAEA